MPYTVSIRTSELYCISQRVGMCDEWRCQTCEMLAIQTFCSLLLLPPQRRRWRSHHHTYRHQQHRNRIHPRQHRRNVQFLPLSLRRWRLWFHRHSSGLESRMYRCNVPSPIIATLNNLSSCFRGAVSLPSMVVVLLVALFAPLYNSRHSAKCSDNTNHSWCIRRLVCRLQHRSSPPRIRRSVAYRADQRYWTPPS